jgi:hypothetical protein
MFERRHRVLALGEKIGKEKNHCELDHFGRLGEHGTEPEPAARAATNHAKTGYPSQDEQHHRNDQDRHC